MVRTWLTRQAFVADPHGAKYRGEIEAHPEAFARLLDILNDPENEQRLIDAERLDAPALSGVVTFVEGEPSIRSILVGGASGNRFRQTVGVAVKLKMARLSWTTTGRKGPVRGAHLFATAEHYRPLEATGNDAARSALETVAALGDEAERRATGRELMEALRSTREADGRVF